MRLFTVYRLNVPEAHYDQHAANPPADPQFEGCVFSGGRVVVNWLTPNRSFSVWDDFDTLMAVHGHPEYDTRIHWSDGSPTFDVGCSWCGWTAHDHTEHGGGCDAQHPHPWADPAVEARRMPSGLRFHTDSAMSVPEWASDVTGRLLREAARVHPEVPPPGWAFYGSVWPRDRYSQPLDMPAPVPLPPTITESGMTVLEGLEHDQSDGDQLSDTTVTPHQED